jgi:apolipoprotein N-acyltransferase
LSGFPWAVLGYAQYRNVALLPLAAFAAVYGLSFVTALASFAGLELVQARRRGMRASGAAWAALALVLLVHGAGFVALAREAPGEERTLRVAVLQGNIDQDAKWSPEWADATMSIYESLAREAAEQGAQVIVWPETAIPGSVEHDPAFRERVEALVRSLGAVHVVGGVGIERHGEELRFFDSAFLLDASGTLRDRYDKAHLVPFGEYVPLRDVLGLFVSAVASGIAPDNVTPGARARALALPVREGAVLAGVPICYELLFPDLVRRFVGDGATLLLAITNDAWYGRTGAPHQFLAITALRAAETRMWTARAANTGVSAVIDDRGRVREATRIFERGLLVADLPLRPASAGRSFYVRHGDVFAWLCWAGLAAPALYARFGGGARRGAGEETR